MNLIDRYLHEVGRYLPRKSRADILAELRSTLMDTLEGRGQAEASEDAVVAVLTEFGPPQQVAASYSARGQYLIGPALYPLFRMVAGIVLAALIGAQLLAFGLGFWLGVEILSPWQALLGLLQSIPSALGALVVIFAILQWFDVRPELDDKPWDPRSLPEIVEAESIKRGERIFGIAAGSVILAFLVLFPEKIGAFKFPGGEFYPNPVIEQYLSWISLALLVSIGLDIYLLWQGRWSLLSRVAHIASSLLSLVVLALLIQGHNAWLAERGAVGFLPSIEKLAENAETGWHLMVMESFRLGFGIALVVVAIITVFEIFRLVRSILESRVASQTPGA